ncbi:MAG: hypothetical protein PHR28_09195 [candidate division Zixibacteria bacterium]|nr:hypothetical protein [candidate division Zixibacteria bacterium]
MSLSEAEMYVCAHGHTFCTHHAQDALSKDVVIAYVAAMLSLTNDEKRAIIDYLQAMDAETYQQCTETTVFVDCGDNRVVDTILAKCDDVLTGHDDLSQYTIEERYPSACCPICQMEVVLDADVLRYLCAKHGVTTEMVGDEIRRTFATYEDLMTYIKKTGEKR